MQNNKSKVKGGAMYIALLLVSCTLLVFTLIVFQKHFEYKIVQNHITNQRLELLAKSAMKSRIAFETTTGTMVWESINDYQDTLSINSQPWGCFKIASATAKNKNQVYSECALYGSELKENLGLMLPPANSPISFAGNFKTDVNCFVPTGSILSGRVDGVDFLAGSAVYSFLKNASEAIQLSTDVKNNIKTQFQISSSDSLVNDLPSTYSRKFEYSTVVHEENSTKLSGHYFGKVKFICNKIEIDSTLTADHIVVVCKVAHLLPGFKGRLHILATDSLIIESDCTLELPSSLILLSTNSSCQEPTILFKGNSSMAGCVLAYKNADDSNPVHIQFSSTGKYYGTIYSENSIHLEGQFAANVYTNSLLLKKASGSYLNYAMNTEFSVREHYEFLCGAPLFDKPELIQICDLSNFY